MTKQYTPLADWASEVRGPWLCENSPGWLVQQFKLGWEGDWNHRLTLAGEALRWGYGNDSLKRFVADLTFRRRRDFSRWAVSAYLLLIERVELNEFDPSSDEGRVWRVWSLETRDRLESALHLLKVGGGAPYQTCKKMMAELDESFGVRFEIETYLLGQVDWPESDRLRRARQESPCQWWSIATQNVAASYQPTGMSWVDEEIKWRVDIGDRALTCVSLGLYLRHDLPEHVRESVEDVVRTGPYPPILEGMEDWCIASTDSILTELQLLAENVQSGDSSSWRAGVEGACVQREELECVAMLLRWAGSHRLTEVLMRIDDECFTLMEDIPPFNGRSRLIKGVKVTNPHVWWVSYFK